MCTCGMSPTTLVSETMCMYHVHRFDAHRRRARPNSQRMITFATTNRRFLIYFIADARSIHIYRINYYVLVSSMQLAY